MKNLFHILKGQSLRVTAVFMILLISAPASLTQRRMTVSNEPEYHCQRKIYPFSEVETVRETACRGFISTRKSSRRPIVYTEDDAGNLIFEWRFPFHTSKSPEGKRIRITEKITFNNSCELKEVLYYNGKKRKFEPCIKVPDVSIITSSEIEKTSTMPLIRCGSLSWELSDIQIHSSHQTSKFLDGFVEVKYTSSEDDGPWRRRFISKRVTLSESTQLVFYEVIVNNQNEVRGLVVTHNISRIPTASKNSSPGLKRKPNQKFKQKKETIKLVCLLDKKFPLFSSTLTSNLSNQNKRKDRE